MNIVQAILAALLLALCNTVNADGCEYDTQCKGDRVCEKGNCVDSGGANSYKDESDNSATLLGDIFIELPPFHGPCHVNLKIDLVGKWFTPFPPVHRIQGIPLGRTMWTIRGNIHCDTGEFCVSNGSNQSGSVTLRDGETYRIDWEIPRQTRGLECHFRLSG